MLKTILLKALDVIVFVVLSLFAVLTSPIWVPRLILEKRFVKNAGER